MLPDSVRQSAQRNFDILPLVESTEASGNGKTWTHTLRVHFLFNKEMIMFIVGEVTPITSQRLFYFTHRKLHYFPIFEKCSMLCNASVTQILYDPVAWRFCAHFLTWK